MEEIKNEKIKVAIAINDFVVGGAQKLITELFKKFDSDKFEWHLITLFQFPEKWEFYDLLPNYVQIHKFNFRGGKDVIEIFKLLKKLRKLKLDIVITNIFLTSTIFRILKPFTGYKIAVIKHNTEIFRSKWQEWVDRILNLITDSIIAEAPTVADFTVKTEGVKREKIKIIPGVVNLEKIENAKKNFNRKEILRKIGFDEKNKIIINVARLTHQKNHKLLIDGFAEFVKKHPEYKLIIISEGTLKNELLKQTSDLKISDKVSFLGLVDNIYKYYLVSDFFAISSFMEGFCLSAVEAMACGIPVVSTKTAGPDEYIQNGYNGYLMDGFSVNEMAGILEKMHNSDIKTMGENARKTVEKYSVDKVAKMYENLILEVVNK
ncbi:MAG: glycosyltransferase family 4 protein [Candidatus Terrybacteria bacterium]|nr:glycosyltransferase family 4 protein [Candidatus Terrybacteria bacterium]